MAVILRRVCDLTGAEDAGVLLREWEVDGTRYYADLSDDAHKELIDAMARFVAVAQVGSTVSETDRRAGLVAKENPGATHTDKERNMVRTFAEKYRIKVSRGQWPADVWAAARHDDPTLLKPGRVNSATPAATEA